MDVDCIVTADIFNIFDAISSEKLIGFGRDGDKKSMHLAVLYSRKPNNPILKKWRQEAQKRLENIPDTIDWSYFGNSILNPILADEKYKNNFYIIDRSISGNILESTIFPDFDNVDPINNYRNFYFNEFIQISNEVLKLITCGVVSLHNSWTPNQYKNIYNTDEFLRTNVLLAKFLNFILYSNENCKLVLKNSFVHTEIYLRNIFKNYNILYKKKYFKKVLVYDFNIDNNLFAFDIIYNYKTDKLSLFMILRNIHPTQLLDLEFFSDFVFDYNKISLLENSDIEIVGENIIKIINLIKEYVSLGMISASSSNLLKKDLFRLEFLIEDSAFVNILMLKKHDSKLFLEGEAFIVGCNVKMYSDIQYTLEFLNDQDKYEFPLAKLHKPEITKKYSNDINISYDKCYVSTYDNQGIDLSSLKDGKYKIFLKIQCEDIIKKQKLRTNDISSNFDTNILEIEQFKDFFIINALML